LKYQPSLIKEEGSLIPGAPSAYTAALFSNATAFGNARFSSALTRRASRRPLRRKSR
jgi:hypothetical protein